MSTDDLLRQLDRLGDDDRFVRATKTGRKIKCTACGASGHLGGSWMDRHRGPDAHRLCLLGCGKMLAVRKGGNAWHRCPR